MVDKLPFMWKWKYRPAYDWYSAPIWFGYDQVFVTAEFMKDFKHLWMLRFPHLMWLLSVAYGWKARVKEWINEALHD
jgi:hypothetical protein